MADFKRTTLIGGRSNSSSNVLGKLRDVQIISSQFALPITILDLVLDYVPVPELIRFARTSKRMRDLVYDDTRWVKKLRLMGCWNETEARAIISPRHFQSGAEKPISETGKSSTSPDLRSVQNRLSISLSRASNKTNTELLAEASTPSDWVGKKVDEFSKSPLSPKSPKNEQGMEFSLDGSESLNIFRTVKSVRGQARQEYGRVHAVLRPFYKDAIRVKTPSNAKIFRIYRDPKQQAQMLVQVQIFAKSDTSPGQYARAEQLSTLMSAFEDAVANEFEQGLEIEDVDGRMRKYAHVLTILNGGQRAVNQYLAHSLLLQGKEQLGEPSDCLSHNNTDTVFIEEIHGFCSRLSISVNHQLSIMKRVFPPSVAVIGPFIVRLGIGPISTFVKQLLHICRQRSVEAHLRATSTMFQQLFQCSLTFNFPPITRQELLDQFNESVVEIFTPFFGTYLADENSFFQGRAETEISAWERQLSQQDSSIESLYMANVNRQADKRDFLSSFKKVVMMPVNALPSFQMGGKPAVAKAADGANDSGSTLGTISSDPSQGQTPNYTTRNNRSSSRPPSPLPQAPTTELAAKAAIMKARLEGIGSLFSLEMALNLVHMAKACIERMAVFTVANNDFAPGARGQCEAIFTELVQIVGERHVRSGFDKAVDHLANYNPRAVEGRSAGQPSGVAPLAMFLELVNVGDLIQQMLDVFFEQEMVAARLTDKQDFLNPTVKAKKKFEQMLDERVAAGLNKGIEVLMAEVEYQFATTQKSEDYNPDVTATAGNQILDVGPSATACAVVELVSSHTSMLVGSTDKSLLDVFNQEVGLRLYNSFCKHLKRQRISTAGSIRLISDINHYYAFILTLKNKDLQQYFNALRELSQIYLIAPENAKEIATIIADHDRFRGILRSEEVYEFTERRADWYQIRGRVEKAMYGVGCEVM